MNYYYNKDGKNIGPVNMEELKALAEKGEIGPKTPVIESGKKIWMRWEALSGTEEKMGGTAPTMPHLKTGRATGLRPTSLSRQSQTNHERGSSDGIMCFFDEITKIYEKIDAFLMKICYLPEGMADTPEICEKHLRFLSAPVGVSVLLCIISFCLANEVYESVKLTALILGAGCVLQYLCYQLYNAMIPLLLGKKIRLSSMRMPKVVAMICAVLILATVWWATKVPELKVKDLLLMIICVIYLAGVGYVCLNSQKLFVAITPKDVVPGREMVNLIRFTLRAIFTALHVLTPVLMILTALMILTSGTDTIYSFSPEVVARIGLLAYGAFLPIVTFFTFCLSSMIPDFMETIFAASDRNNNNSEEQI